MPAVGLCTNCRELMCRLISENVQCSIFSVNWLKCSITLRIARPRNALWSIQCTILSTLIVWMMRMTNCHNACRQESSIFPSQISLSDCCEAHRRTRLTKGHVISNLGDEGPRHPKKDEKEGVEVPRDSVSYLLAVYSVLPPGNTLLLYISLFSGC